jgi:hypothetical protein
MSLEYELARVLVEERHRRLHGKEPRRDRLWRLRRPRRAGRPQP